MSGKTGNEWANAATFTGNWTAEHGMNLGDGYSIDVVDANCAVREG